MSTRIKERLDRLLTQYRESPNLIETIRSQLIEVERASDALAAIPASLQLDTATGDQLTILGKRLGWPRKHCICTTTPVFGFEEGYTGPFEIAGLGDENSNWAAYEDGGIADFVIADDEIYRKFLKVRILQSLGRFDLDTLRAAVTTIWADAWVPAYDGRGVVIAPMQSGLDVSLLQLWPRVLPVSVGVPVYYHLGTSRDIFGFGCGWAGLASEGDDVQIATEGGDELATESLDLIAADVAPTTKISDWLYPVESSPC